MTTRREFLGGLGQQQCLLTGAPAIAAPIAERQQSFRFRHGRSEAEVGLRVIFAETKGGSTEDLVFPMRTLRAR